MKRILCVLVVLAGSLFALDQARGDDITSAVPIFVGKDASFQSDKGFFYNAHGGGQSSTAVTFGTSVGYDFKYVGVEFDYDKGGIMTTGRPSDTTGAKVMFQYPYGQLTPWVSLGVTYRFMQSGNRVVMQRSLGAGFNFDLSRTTSLFASYSAIDSKKSQFFSKGSQFVVKVGIKFRF